MLDITHYLLEEDSLRGLGMAEDPGKAVDDMRAIIYGQLYGQNRPAGSDDDDYAVADPERPDQVRERKPYVPPTEVTENEALPYGNVVGAPLGY